MASLGVEDLWASGVTWVFSCGMRRVRRGCHSPDTVLRRGFCVLAHTNSAPLVCAHHTHSVLSFLVSPN